MGMLVGIRLGYIRKGSVQCALFLAAAAWSNGLAAQSPLKSMDAYERVQTMRREAGEMAKSGRPEDLAKGLTHLETALAYLANEQVRELAVGNAFLYAREHDVRMDMASMYVRLGDNEAALAALEAMQQIFWSEFPLLVLGKNEALDALKDDPRLKAFVARANVPKQLWQASAIATPYKERLTIEERIAGLSLFWAEARQSFVHFRHAGKAWGDEYMRFLPRVMAAESTRDYYRVMMEFAATLGDGHTDVHPPQELVSSFFARPPIRTEKVGEGVFVTAVLSQRLAEQVGVGDEVLAIDGTPVLDYAARCIEPIVSSSTSQDKAVRTFSHLLLAGPADAPVKLTLRSATGVRSEVAIPRAGYTDVRPRKAFEFRALDGGIAYLSLDHFESPAGVKAFEAALPEILKSKGLILDLRNNGGGSTSHGLEVLSYLVKGPIPVSASRMRNDLAVGRELGVRWAPWPLSGFPYDRPKQTRFEGPVAVLIGPRTFSAAEDFVVSFDTLNRGTLVGSATAGSTGQPMFFSLPGGGKARICVKADSYPDGRQFVGKGIAPKIQVEATAEDIRGGRDPVLGAAVKALSGASANSPLH